ncbi:RIP metalloprotease RseP [Helicobacter winghamensis]|uniref:Zinc metalloprotease n=1 Tax=Helicobacter winghamensis TaxID=157268 RepID=A0A2N3PHA2_9HELI|nr:RIP metalloprotease RseP [Helicobacter winghamensis]EEO26540.1 RIP metalloprotease RseP [Helicobacter winghamensis ATCC BAA-430]PKT75407.1 RIP metalloprotease RseP [Helicobacter winghamensis]PKT75575.1 RIP metalloprotease RseP [Helicobacter winghamensis]PKT79489.1 RIP metalloprotease RseP [Helicobacter winghamensis]PKT79788.1 RIP metalloprotease RseP [Helicobacter winghamensis]
MGLIGSILVLSFLIFFHELGHFLAAKFFGVKVEAFSIGFGKQRLWKKRIGDTEYSLRPIPLGGFVQLKGQSDIDPKLRNSDSDSLYGIAHWKRLVILAAGSFFNLLLAFLLFVAIGLIGKNELAPIVGKVESNMPASLAGLKSGDEIVAINGEKIRTWGNLSSAIAESKGELEIVFLRENKEYETTITPQFGNSKNLFGESIQRPLLGIVASGEVRVVSYGILDSIFYGLKETKESSKLILQSLEKMLVGVVPLSEVGGVVSIVSITKKATELGIVTLFAFSALISVNLGILNLLPIPALDGGHILFTLYEMISKRIPTQETLYRLSLAGWIVLLGLMGLGLYNDVLRIINGTMPF